MGLESRKIKYLEAKGWHTWYNPKYWVHPDSIEDPSSQDYTNYGMTIDDAIKYEKLGKPKHRLMPLPIMSQMDVARRTKGLTKKEI